jgi:hypothetical protein
MHCLNSWRLRTVALNLNEEEIVRWNPVSEPHPFIAKAHRSENIPARVGKASIVTASSGLQTSVQAIATFTGRATSLT